MRKSNKYSYDVKKSETFYYVQQVYLIKLQYPVNIKNPNPKLAQFIITQLGGLNFIKI